MANPKRPRDPNQRAKLIVEIATGESDEPKGSPRPKNEARSRGGKAGGKARAQTLTPERRRAIARTAAESRWRKAQP